MKAVQLDQQETKHNMPRESLNFLNAALESQLKETLQVCLGFFSFIQKLADFQVSVEISL